MDLFSGYGFAKKAREMLEGKMKDKKVHMIL